MINNKKEFKMNKDLKHLKYFSNYIAEQDLGEEGAAAPIPEPIYSVLFIEEGDEGDYTFPDGSSSKRYVTYEIIKPDLVRWLETTIDTKSSGLSKDAVEIKRKSLLDYIAGVRDSVTPDDKEYVNKFKNAIQAGLEGTKTQDSEVIFSPKHKIPTTDVVDVTFITIKK